MIAPETDRVPITGAAGAIGTALRVGLRDRWRHLRLTDIRPVPDLAANEELVVADIADRPALEAMTQGAKAVVHLVDVALRHPDPGCMVINGYSSNTRLKTFDPNWATLGYRPKDNAEDHRARLRAEEIDVDAPDRGEWEWPEHGGPFPRLPERPVR